LARSPRIRSLIDSKTCCQAAPRSTERTESQSLVADQFRSWPPRGREAGRASPALCPARPRQADARLQLPSVRPLHFHSPTLALSLSSALPCSRRRTRPSHRTQHRLRRRLVCATSHHHRLHLAHSCATPPSTPRLDCSGCHASVRAYSPFPFSPEFSVAIAASMESSP